MRPSNTSPECDYEDIVKGFLLEIAYKQPDHDFDIELKTRVECAFESHGLSREFVSRIGPYIDTAIDIASFAYPFASREARDYIAIFTSYCVAIDDLAPEIITDLRDYMNRLVLRKTHGHQLLRGLTKFLGGQQTWRIFGQFGGDMIVKSTLEYISVTVVEQNQENNLHFCRDASDYLFFFRAKTGLSEAYAFFCFPDERDLTRYITAIPSLMVLLCYINDILSFYKEESEAGDPSGLIQNYAKAFGLTSLQSLCHIRKKTVEEARKICRIMSGDAVMAENLNRFISGYIFFHLVGRRYRLDELNIPAAVESRIVFEKMVEQKRRG
ncbi:terpenoid synthase [Penicillium verhagenii]|uniref:terpenoid synthase n=1 Tax=Penicillium verhagenii TaxID=1562060 RepID=UPI0025451033|nr:terpenoid synthase [Penicillium verhagenii]KAJ5931117.1 terpenoid synthase [Penicillium verhagenii]